MVYEIIRELFCVLLCILCCRQDFLIQLSGVGEAYGCQQCIFVPFNNVYLYHLRDFVLLSYFVFLIILHLEIGSWMRRVSKMEGTVILFGYSNTLGMTCNKKCKYLNGFLAQFYLTYWSMVTAKMVFMIMQKLIVTIEKEIVFLFISECFPFLHLLAIVYGSAVFFT